MQPSISYLLYATARSGSTLLCEALTGTGIAGRPDEYFVPAQSTLRQPTWFGKLGTMPFPDYVREIVANNTTENGVFGAKFSWAVHRYFIAEMRTYPEYRDLSDHAILSSFFPNLRYVYVTRRDKIRQAISEWKAIQDNVWNSEGHTAGSAGNLSFRPVKTPPRFSFSLINEELLLIVDSEALLSAYFTANRIVPCTVVYEDLAMDYEGTARAVIEYLGMPTPDPIVLGPRRLQKQSSSLNDEWYQRYLRRRVLQYRLHRLLGIPQALRNPNTVRWFIYPPLERLLSAAPRPIRRLAGRV